VCCLFWCPGGSRARTGRTAAAVAGRRTWGGHQNARGVRDSMGLIPRAAVLEFRVAAWSTLGCERRPRAKNGQRLGRRRRPARTLTSGQNLTLVSRPPDSVHAPQYAAGPPPPGSFVFIPARSVQAARGRRGRLSAAGLVQFASIEHGRRCLGNGGGGAQCRRSQARPVIIIHLWPASPARLARLFPLGRGAL
jgi:hypothetical protein